MRNLFKNLLNIQIKGFKCFFVHSVQLNHQKFYSEVFIFLFFKPSLKKLVLQNVSVPDFKCGKN
jgi:hypothetical protein